MVAVASVFPEVSDQVLEKIDIEQEEFIVIKSLSSVFEGFPKLGPNILLQAVCVCHPWCYKISRRMSFAITLVCMYF